VTANHDRARRQAAPRCERCSFLNACGGLLVLFAVVVIVAVALFAPDLAPLRAAP